MLHYNIDNDALMKDEFNTMSFWSKLKDKFSPSNIALTVTFGLVSGLIFGAVIENPFSHDSIIGGHLRAFGAEHIVPLADSVANFIGLEPVPQHDYKELFTQMASNGGHAGSELSQGLSDVNWDACHPHDNGELHCGNLTIPAEALSKASTGPVAPEIQW